jgi:protocatechuate 3,4-dioxygenase beta subunit
MDLVELHPGLVASALGTPIVLEGRLIDIDGRLANGAVVEFWQANSKGIYRTPLSAGHPDLDPLFDGYARTRTADGTFRLRTIKPGVAPGSGRAPNITLTIFSDGITRVVTQLFFADEQTNANDPLLASLPVELTGRLIAGAVRVNAAGEQVYAIDIVMAGQGETPFFDDLLS